MTHHTDTPNPTVLPPPGERAADAWYRASSVASRFVGALQVGDTIDRDAWYGPTDIDAMILYEIRSQLRDRGLMLLDEGGDIEVVAAPSHGSDASS